MKRLFRMDNEAIDVKWEVVIEDEKADNHEAGGEKQVLAQGAYTTNREDKKAMQNLLEVGTSRQVFFSVFQGLLSVLCIVLFIWFELHLYYRFCSL